jgi:hypothetical protein
MPPPLLTCSAATADITPRARVPLAGYVQRKGAFESIATPLEANAVLLSDGQTRCLFVAADLLYCGPDLEARVRQRAAHHGIATDNIVLSASHTHFAPATDRGKQAFGLYDEAYNVFLGDTIERLIDRVAAAVPKPSFLFANRRSATLNIHRRRRWPYPILNRSGVQMGPNICMAPAPETRIDNEIDALQLRDESGQIRAVLWKYACHPVGFPDWQKVSSEYPGRARDRLRARLGAPIPIVFWQGFAGDVRPPLPARRSVTNKLRAFLRGPSFGPVSFEEWDAWSERLATEMAAAVLDEPARPAEGAIAMSVAEIDYAKLIDIAANPQLAGRMLRIQRFAAGDTLEAYFAGAEMCSPYLDGFGAGPHTICAGYTGDVFGYMPTETYVEEGGYEGGFFFNYFGMQGKMRPGFENAVIAAANGLRTQPSS